MIAASTIKFLNELSVNNNKPWFDGHRDEYEQAKEDFEAFVTGLINGLAEKDPVYKEQKAKNCVFRIYRDVRFSKDKTPYKDHFGAYISKGGKKFNGAGFYVHLHPGNRSFAGGGLWEPEPEILKAVRQEVDYNFADFKKIIDDKKFKKLFEKIAGEQAKKAPQGYTEDNPAIDYLKMKSYTVMHQLPDTVIAGKDVSKKVADVFTNMWPFIDFLNHAVG